MVLQGRGSLASGWRRRYVLDGDTDLDQRSATRTSIDRELSAERTDTLAHRHKTVRSGVVGLRRVDSHAIVGDPQHPRVVGTPQRDCDVLRLRILADIGKRFLDDTIERDAVRRR